MSRSHNQHSVPPRYRRQSRRQGWKERTWRKWRGVKNPNDVNAEEQMKPGDDDA